MVFPEMIEKNVCSMDCNEEKSLQKFSAQFGCLLVYAEICRALSLDETLKLFRQLQQLSSTYCTK